MHAQEKSEETNRQTHAHCQKDILTHSLNPSHTLHPFPHIPPPPPPSLAPLPLSVVSGWDDLSGEKSSVTMETGAWGESRKTVEICTSLQEAALDCCDLTSKRWHRRSPSTPQRRAWRMPHAHTASPSEKIRWCGLHTVAKNVQMYLQLLLLSLLELLSQPCLWRRLRQTSCSRHPHANGTRNKVVGALLENSIWTERK